MTWLKKDVGRLGCFINIKNSIEKLNLNLRN
jgi:hypothetical protein